MPDITSGVARNFFWQTCESEKRISSKSFTEEPRRSGAAVVGGFGGRSRSPTVQRCFKMHSAPLRITVLSNEINGTEHALVLLAMQILV